MSTRYRDRYSPPMWLIALIILGAALALGMGLASVLDAQPRKTKQYTDFYSSSGKLIMHAYADGVLPDIAEGDSIRGVVRERYTSNGRTIPIRYFVTWGNNQPLTVRVSPRGALHDTAWIVALNCQCREPGATLRYINGRYQYYVSDLGGNWHPVTKRGG